MIQVYKLIETRHLVPMEIALTDNEIVEIDSESRVIMQSYDVGSISDIIRMNTFLPGIQIVFKDNVLLTYIPPVQLRGLVISNIFTVGNWKRSNQELYKFQQDAIYTVMPNYSQKTFGWDANGVDLDYEIDLIKRFSNPLDDDHFYASLREFNINANLTRFTDNEPKPLQFLM